MDYIGLTIDLARIAGTGLVAGLFTTFIAATDHRQKKWWELRVTSYQAVIEALSDMAYIYDVRYQVMRDNTEIPIERNTELAELASQAYTRVRKAADTGAFIFSEEANSALAVVREEWENDDRGLEERFEALRFSSRQCLRRLVALSLEDLRLKRNFYVWK